MQLDEWAARKLDGFAISARARALVAARFNLHHGCVVLTVRTLFPSKTSQLSFFLPVLTLPGAPPVCVGIEFFPTSSDFRPTVLSFLAKERERSTHVSRQTDRA